MQQLEIKTRTMLKLIDNKIKRKEAELQELEQKREVLAKFVDLSEDDKKEAEVGSKRMNQP